MVAPVRLLRTNQVPVEDRHTDRSARPSPVKSKSGFPVPPDPAVITKLASEMSKNIFPTASTLTRACEVVRLGIWTDCAPSFGVLLARIRGKLLPPSVDSEIVTLAVLIG